MRFMIIVKSCEHFESDPTPLPDEALLAEMLQYHEALAQAGVLLDAAGLQPSRTGWRVHYGADGQKRVVDGPFADAPALMAGYTLIQVRSREEAQEWARRYPNPVGKGQAAVIELRQLFEMDDFPPSPPVDGFKRFDAEQKSA